MLRPSNHEISDENILVSGKIRQEQKLWMAQYLDVFSNFGNRYEAMPTLHAGK